MEIYDSLLRKFVQAHKKEEPFDPKELGLVQAKLVNRAVHSMFEAREYLILLEMTADQEVLFQRGNELQSEIRHWNDMFNKLELEIYGWAFSRGLQPDAHASYPDTYPMPVKFGGGAVELEREDTSDLKLVPADKVMEDRKFLGYCRNCLDEIKMGMGGIPYCGCGKLEGYEPEKDLGGGSD